MNRLLLKVAGRHEASLLVERTCASREHQSARHGAVVIRHTRVENHRDHKVAGSRPSERRRSRLLPSLQAARQRKRPVRIRSGDDAAVSRVDYLVLARRRLLAVVTISSTVS